MVLVIIVVIFDLFAYLSTSLGTEMRDSRNPTVFFGRTLLDIFGLS